MSSTGIGGFFFRADEPDLLSDWYRTHLGVGADVASPWVQESGPTLVLPFARDSDAWPPGKEWMLNFRVDDLDALLTSLAAAGIATTTDPSWDTPETGRFARVTDPEGNPVELWEPPTPDARRPDHPGVRQGARPSSALGRGRGDVPPFLALLGA